MRVLRSRRVARQISLSGSLLLLGAHAVSGQRPDSALGEVDFGVACDPSVAQEFDRAVALLHHMTYPAALAAFEGVTRADPDCALGYWGAAMTLFQPLWPNRPSPEDLRRGWALTQEARRRVAEGGREAMFVATAEAFFNPEGAPDYWQRISRWEAATSELFAAYADDREARAFFALSQLAIAALGDAQAHHGRAAAVLSAILAEEPTHPGGVHYLIHANDFSGREHESLDVVRRYSEIAPSNPHALHMPTHIFVRLGEWDQVIDWNARAADAALQQRVGTAGEFVWDEYPHAIEYMVYAQLQRADDGSAAELIRVLRATPDLQPTFKTAFHISSTAVRYAVERRDWRLAADLTLPAVSGLNWGAFPWPEALLWFGRGLGAAHIAGAEATVAESLRHLDRLAQSPAARAEPVFSQQIEILRIELTAWGSFAAGDRDGAVEQLEEAAALEGRAPKHPVTPGPVVPALELLGDLYLEAGDPAPALDAYRASEGLAPGRFNTTLGIARASAALGESVSARSHYRALLDQAARSSTRPELAEARAYLAGG